MDEPPRDPTPTMKAWAKKNELPAVAVAAAGAGAQAAEILTVLAELDKLRFDIHNPPPKPKPIWELCGFRIATPGNLVAVQAQAKAGKSAFLGAMMAAAIASGTEHLGVTCNATTGRWLLHFDSEQAPDDHHEGIERVLRRAGLAEPPAWLASYRIVEMTLAKRKAAFLAAMDRAHGNGGLLGVVLDGAADLVADPNDQTECIGFLDELHQRAVRYHCPIVVVLHENPGSDTGKTRGHLGSQLQRKAETNLRLVKESDGSTVVYTENSRHAHIPQGQGPAVCVG